MGNCLRLLQQQDSIPKSIDVDDQLAPVFTDSYTDSVDIKPITKKVRFSDDEEEVEEGGTGRSLRVKLVISKQKLKEMIANGGVISINSLMQNQESVQLVNFERCNEDCSSVSGKGWKPALKSIPESEYFS